MQSHRQYLSIVALCILEPCKIEVKYSMTHTCIMHEYIYTFFMPTNRSLSVMAARVRRRVSVIVVRVHVLFIAVCA